MTNDDAPAGLKPLAPPSPPPVGADRLASAIEQQAKAIKAQADAIDRNTEAVMLLVHSVAALLGEETGQPVQAEPEPDSRLSTLDG